MSFTSILFAPLMVLLPAASIVEPEPVLASETAAPEAQPSPELYPPPDAPAGAPDTGENLAPSEMTVEATIEVGFGIL